MFKTNVFVVLLFTLIFMVPFSYAEESEHTVRLIGTRYLPVTKGNIEGGFALTYYRQKSDEVLNDPNRIAYGDHEVITEALYLSYGVTDKLSVNTFVPYRTNKMSYDYGDDLSESGVGDISFGASWEFTGPESRYPIIMLNGLYTFDTGKSPFENGNELPTGEGFPSIETSLTFHKPVEIFVPYALIGYRYAFEVDGIEYESDPYHGERGYWLTSIDPSHSVIVEAGLGISYSERVSFLIGYQFTKMFDTRYYYSTGASYKASHDDIRMLRLGAGIKLFSHCSLYPEFRVYRGEDDPGFEGELRVAFF